LRSIISRNYCYHQSNRLRVVHPLPYEYLAVPHHTSTGIAAGQISKAAWIPALGVFRSIPDAESAHTDLWQKYKGLWQASAFRADPFFLLQTVCAPEQGRFPTHCFYWTGLDSISCPHSWGWIIAFIRIFLHKQTNSSPYTLQEVCSSETSMSQPRRLKSEHVGLVWCIEPRSRYSSCLRPSRPCPCSFSCLFVFLTILTLSALAWFRINLILRLHY
jgi:hypothetical protein